MRGLLMVERDARSEVARLHERDAEPPARGLVGAGQSMNAAPDDEHVVGA